MDIKDKQSPFFMVFKQTLLTNGYSEEEAMFLLSEMMNLVLTPFNYDMAGASKGLLLSSLDKLKNFLLKEKPSLIVEPTDSSASSPTRSIALASSAP